MPDPAKNTGIVIVPLSPKAFRFGGESGVGYEVRLKNGDWFNYSATDEKQYSEPPNSNFDTSSCTTFSALNSLEAQVNWLVANGKIPEDVLKLLKELGFFDANGKFNCSDWFTAVMSGTKVGIGNDFGSVWDSIRNHGVLPESKGRKPSDFTYATEYLDATKVTTEQKALALRFLEIFEVVYEYILTGTPSPETIAYHLKHAPIHIAAPICEGWSAPYGVVKKCPVLGVQHATLVDGVEDKVAIYDFDQYVPFHKRLAWDYHIPWAVKGVLSLKAPKPKAEKPVYTFTQSLQSGSTGKEVEMWQRALKYYGFFKLDYFTQYFGFRTEQAVKDFQAAYAKDILTPIGLTLPTGKVASMTIKKMNALLKQI